MQHSRRAFTLIELALVLVIVSMMTGFGLQAFDGTAGVNCAEATQTQLKAIDQALQNFAAKNQRLPKPSLMRIGTTDTNFGREALGTMTAPTDPTLPAFATYVPPGITASNNTLIGALPHATLGLPAQYAADCWGDKFTYAVTNSQTSSDSGVGYPSGTPGDIKLKGGATGNMLSSNITYVVVSHGQDKYGATAMQAANLGATPSACGAASKIDQKNCDLDDVFYTSVQNTGDTSNYFDDMMAYSSKIQSTEDCPDQVISWGAGCTASTGNMIHDATQHIVSSTDTFSGTVDIKCHDGTITQTSPTCYPSHPCPAQHFAWSTGCQGDLPTLIHHTQTAGAFTNTVANKWGTASVQCMDGTLSVTSNTCGNTSACTPGGAHHQWGPTGSECSITPTALALNASNSGSNENSNWYTGSSTYTCTQDSYSTDASSYHYVDGACTYVPPANCTAQTLPYGSGCSISAPATLHNANTAVLPNTAANRTGSAQAHCFNGTYDSVSNMGCYADCPANPSVAWAPGCTGSYPVLHHGDGLTFSNGASGYTGSYTVSCSNGVISGGANSCTVNGACGAANGGNSPGAPSSSLCASGAASAVTGSGPYNWTCGGTAACSSNRSCVPAPVSWMTSCSVSMASQNSGYAASQSNTAPGYSGSVTVKCDQGVWGIGSDGVCSAIPGCAAGWSAIYHYSDEASYDCRNYDVTVGTCTSGTGGNSPSSTGRNDHCIDPGSCVDARQCGCVADGTAVPNHGYGPTPQLCCNGDSDGNGTCGTQSAVVNGVCGASSGTCSAGTLSGAVLCNNACPDVCNWNCNGSGGGTNAPCSSSTACAVPVCGGAPYTCTTGTPDTCQYHSCSAIGASGQDAYNWSCVAGVTSVNCSNNCGPASCFLPEVSITLADGSSKSVSALKAGDAVKGETRTNHVIRVPAIDVHQSVYGFNGGKAFVTGGHPFFTAEGWKAIDPSLTPHEGHHIKTTKLEIGDVLQLDDGGTVRIDSIEHEDPADHGVFNPMVDGDHTYYANHLLVHNKSVYPCDDIDDFSCSNTSYSCSGTPCTNDGSPPGGGGCCNPDTDGNGLCGFQATPTCAAGWSAIFTETSEAVMPDCVQTRDNDGHGDCTSGTGGTTASTTGNISQCHAGITGGGPCALKTRICGCLADGDSPTNYGTGAPTSLCCNGDPDSDGVCGSSGGGACSGDDGYCTGSFCYIQCNGTCATCANPYGNVSQVDMPGAGCDGSLCPPPPPACAPSECRSWSGLNHSTCGGCEPNGSQYQTYGAGCRRYRCNNGTWNDIGAGGMCEVAADCS